MENWRRNTKQADWKYAEACRSNSCEGLVYESLIEHIWKHLRHEYLAEIPVHCWENTDYIRWDEGQIWRIPEPPTPEEIHTAEMLCLQVMQGRKDLLGKRHVLFYQTVSLLALVYEAKGDLIEAEAYKALVPEIFERICH